VSKLKRLLHNYSNHIAIPWRHDIAPDQRVMFCVYDETDELRLRAKVEEFELATRHAGHEWALFDLTDTFAGWLSRQRYAHKYFAQPDLLSPLLPKYLDDLTERFGQFLAAEQVDENAVVALQGAGSLYGLLTVKAVVDRFAPQVPGRLLVFFPGVYEDKNYRLLNGYDGWNYLAVPITAGAEA